MARQTTALSQHVHSEPSHGWSALKLFELWDYRELLLFLTWRDIIIRYKQTVLGATWAILQPFLTMIVFTVFFGMVVKVPSDGLPYPLFYFIALVPWMLFANGLTLSSNSLVSSANMIKKVYFPRLAIPVATILAGIGRLCVSVHRWPGLNGLLSLSSYYNRLLVFSIPHPGLGDMPGSGIMVFSIECAIPGYPLRCALRRTGLVVCHAHRVSQLYARGALAYPIWY